MLDAVGMNEINKIFTVLDAMASTASTW